MKVAYHYSYSFADDIALEIVKRAGGVMGIEGVEGVNLYQGDQPAVSVDRPGMLTRVSRRVGRRVRSALGIKGAGQEPRLLSLGSVFQLARSGDVIWGSGVNPVYQQKLPPGFGLDIRAVRGPLSRGYIKKELGLPCPEVFGDPALLMPRLFPEFKARKDEGTLILAQHKDEPYLVEKGIPSKHPNVFICQRPTRLPWQVVVEKILRASFVISTSLHGVIIAETFGIPARWWYSTDLPSAETAGCFKYNDYFASTGRAPDQYAGSIEEALAMGPLEPIKNFDAARLLAAFPKDRFERR